MDGRFAGVCFLLVLLLLANPTSADELDPGTCGTEVDPLDPCIQTLCKWNCELVAMKRGGHLTSYECGDRECKCDFCASSIGADEHGLHV
ncbi:hypothetical protein OsJ_31176 [Oryza sativa Japonica Group]|uniref:Uncharacterized protein n=7 Tax=Oryza TaxID=4527 RepID=A0A979HIZ9_ORYSJ|nr:Hypothetical protein [Oryza sativa Japonica Group]AAP53170.1 hypothetical protein LOC_Os10g20560 [Oryza sativa Japonica Group]EAZ15757.1 hypothetical protein OsJ_31176 [Oryza sativa Japonica Group]KAF2913118.1 hypothetical protein DAI22_10g064800 [Oryza sativa Japonica Group]